MTTEAGDHNEFGLKTPSDIKSEPEIGYQMEDISMAEILEEREETLVDRVAEPVKDSYEGLRNISGPNLKQGVATSAGGFGLQAATGFNWENPVYWVGGITTVSSPVLSMAIPETNLGKFLPKLEKEEGPDRGYLLVGHSVREMVENSDAVEIGGQNVESELAGEMYEEILRDFDSNEEGVNNNLQVMAYEPNQDDWEYRIEIYSSGSGAETVRGITEENPEMYLEDHEEIEYEEAGELLTEKN